MEPSWLQELMAHPFLLLILLCMSLLLFQVIRLYQRKRWMIRALHLFPAPPAHWFYGHKEFYPVKEFEVYHKLMEKYPCAVPLWVGPFTMFFSVHDPDYAKILLKRQDPKSAVSHKILESWVGRGLVTLDGSKWKKHRQIVKPGFNISILKIFITMMSESVRMMLNKWEEHIAQNSCLELFQHVSLMTLDSIMKCAFSHQSSIQLDSTLDSYLKAVFNLSKISYQRVNNFLHHNDLVFKFSSQGPIFSKFNQELHQFTEKVIQDRKESLKDKLKQDTTQKRRRDFLDILLSAKSENTKDFSEADLQAEVKTFMFAGHDTTSSAISWILYCLAKYPEHQQRCRDEIRELLGDGSSITWEHLSQMPYTTMCIKECLRLYAPVVNISRLLDKPITFPDGRSLPAGITVFINIWALHHNPYFWEDPQVFNPLRFSRENSEKIHPYAFIPFSAGLRNCIGQHFAIIECKVAVALTLLRFELAPDYSRPPQPVRQVVLKSKNGIHVFAKKVC
ncbi:cytochrome P450 4Z1 isoform X2 [Nomascus leucogenys]|uniref:cytochrome P450 4Z1 isoform X2 n=1 Tax=Nomascus leucogenys TaxID=61853 RepID=UPI00122D6B30|nr:cytochrome P450 4Z1 isoform X2 [Nomascus leucogenys]